ncbi:uncharacterized protein yc1106_09048 [Curvularia clavata]|uniref:Uncharacterized protein n=1 Tax=Curvularia clavata TaxID=95742 RepID=A0A9Q9DXC5_CURCL|nr:uncharacterized protein yc1106_09048 [Curvularia clavata]
MLNGAPRREDLDFSENFLLPAHECGAFNVISTRETNVAESTPAMKWRCLAKKNTRLQAEWQQPYLPSSILGSNIADVSLPAIDRFPSFAKEDTMLDVTASFLDPTFTTDAMIEHSLIFHDTLVSSQVVSEEGTESTINSSSFLSTSFETTTSDFSGLEKADEYPVVLHLPAKLSITSLASLPSAQRLRAIYPQTPTPNFLCAVTANPETREVFVRRGGYKMDLWEIIIADDSLSGFKVAFWMHPSQNSNSERIRAQSAILQTLQDIKVGDIILLRNIALTSFRDTVFGQSLNPAIARARTDIQVLMKSNGISGVHSAKLPASVDEAFSRVKKWARMHIASDNAGPRKRKGSVMKQDGSVKRTIENRDLDDSMPPDTMESV